MVRLRERTLEFVGRSDRCVKILGELVNLDLLEALLGTSDAALVALPDARRGSKLILVCEEPIAAPDELLSGYNEQVRGFERADGWKRIARIPRSDLGKVRREQLQALVATGDCS